MILQHSLHGRRLVGTLAPGEELVDVLTQICREQNVRAGEIRAVGSFSRAEIARFNHQSRHYEPVMAASGSFDVVTLSGNISRMGEEVVLRLETLLSAMGPAGPQLVAGQLRAATVQSCEFVVDVFEDLWITRRLAPETGQLVIDQIQTTGQPVSAPQAPETPVHFPAAAPAQAPIPRPAPMTPITPGAPAPLGTSPVPAHGPGPRPQTPPETTARPRMSWTEAVAESETASTPASQRAPLSKLSSLRPPLSLGDDDGDDDASRMKPGDILEHPKLGTCRIMKVEEDEYVHVRLPRGKISKLTLEVCEIIYEREEAGRSVFQCRVRK